MKTKALMISGLVMAVATASPVMAYQPYYQQPPVIIQQPRPSTLETVLGIAVIGAGLYWNSPAYQNDYNHGYNGNRYNGNRYHDDGRRYVICTDHGRRYYC
jgi:hypothetical protein